MKQSGFIVFLEIKKAMNNQELDDRFEFYSQIFWGFYINKDDIDNMLKTLNFFGFFHHY